MTKDLARIISAIKEFDAYDSIMDHDRLDVEIPTRFFRFDTTTQHPTMKWDSVDVRLSYAHKVLQFSILLVEKSQNPAFTIVALPRSKRSRRDLYRVKEATHLSIRDAKRLLIFLQDYFCGFDFFITTKLLK